MAIHTLARAVILIGVSALVTNVAFACELHAKSNKAQIRSQLKLLNTQGKASLLYNFDDGKCEPFAKAKNEFDVSTFVPQDETDQGLYTLYRSEGKTRLDALKGVYNFISMSS